jgi:cell division initiation protein
MDVTPHELRTAEFREEFRGYRQKEVDTLLDRAAVTIEQLQVEVRRLGDRVSELESGSPSDREQDDLLRRTLLMAQKAADDAVAEAQSKAHALVSDAESRRTALLESASAQARSTIDSADEHAATTRTDAETRARALVDDATGQANGIQRDAEAKRDAMIADAEHQATTRGEAIRNRLQAECDVLENHRQALSADVDALERFVSSHRERLRSAVQSELAMVDALPELGLPEAPTPTAAATRPTFAPGGADPSEPSGGAGTQQLPMAETPRFGPEARAGDAGSDRMADGSTSTGEESDVILAPPMTGGASGVPEAEARRGRPGWGRTVTAEAAAAETEAEAVAAPSDVMATTDDEAEDGSDGEPFTPRLADDGEAEPLPQRAPGLFTPGQWLPSSRVDDAGNPLPAGAAAAAAGASDAMATADTPERDEPEGESWGPPTEALLVLDDSAEVPVVSAGQAGGQGESDSEIDLDREEPDLDEVAARLREWRSSGASSAWRDDDEELPGIDDPYLAELREAVRDTAPLGPREDDELDLDDLDDEHAESHRFGIFRRRR